MAKPKPRGLLADYIPEPAGLGQPQSEPSLGLLGTAENVSMGLGRGVTNQLAGLLGMVQNPGQVLNSLYGLARTPPNQLAQMAMTGVKDTARNALAGPLGFGEFIGNNISPRTLVGGNIGTVRSIKGYHGTQGDFDAFDLNAPKNTSGGFSRHGVSISDDPAVAKRYASDFAKPGQARRVLDVDAAITKPLPLNAREFEKLQTFVSKIDAGQKLTESQDIDLEMLLSKHGIPYDGSHPVEAIRKSGFDAITKDAGTYGMAEREILVFDPAKIKITGRSEF